MFSVFMCVSIKPTFKRPASDCQHDHLLGKVQDILLNLLELARIGIPWSQHKQQHKDLDSQNVERLLFEQEEWKSRIRDLQEACQS